MSGTHEFYVRCVGSAIDADDFYADLREYALERAVWHGVVLIDVGMTPVATDTHLHPI